MRLNLRRWHMWIYDLAISLYAGLIRMVAPWHGKARLWSEGRRDIFRRLRAAIAPSDRIVWVHAASLGEFEQGRPIIERLRHEHPEYKILLTFFSPSGYEIRKNYSGADYVFYLPADTPSNARRFLDAAHPEIAIFIKYEFWINLLTELRRRSVRSYIVSAIFRRNSVFFRPYGAMWRRALETFDTLFVQNVESKRLLSEIGFDNVVVAGDTRFDRVAEIAAAAKRVEIVERFRGNGRLFVAGSTWGPDEEILLPLINANPEVRFVVAPHEMDEGRIERLLHETKGGAVRYTQCDAAADFGKTQLLILDTVGILSSVYGSAAWAYIGGGFGIGIHNTLEAATFGLPIAFGPNYSKFKEARDMVSLGCATPVHTAEELSAWFAPLRDDEEALRRASRAAKDYTAHNQGATGIILRSIFNS
nr:glycosyltransferase N-terminal domain-containing protein [uncultured Alistipes sp.]